MNGSISDNDNDARRLALAKLNGPPDAVPHWTAFQQILSGEGNLMMFARLSIILLSGAIGLSTTGCSSTSPTMRAQSPASMASWGGGQPCEGGPGACNPDYGPGGMSCDCQSGMYPGDGMCPPGACPPGGGCPQSPCADKCCNLPCHPVHRNFHTYDVPQGLSYPQEDVPPAMYQYPYYTFRGPTDFFMK